MNSWDLSFIDNKSKLKQILKGDSAQWYRLQISSLQFKSACGLKNVPRTANKTSDTLQEKKSEKQIYN